jgi:hypothetical protein
MRALQFLDSGGDIGNAVKMAFQKPNIEYKIVGDRLVEIDQDANTLTEAYSPDKPNTYSKEQVSSMNILRDDLRKDMENFSLTRQGWNNIETFYTNSGGVSDYALAVGFAKILDPGSVAREGEVSAVANAGSLSGALKSQLLNALNGTGKLPEAVRWDIAKLSREMYVKKIPEAQAIMENYKKVAEKVGITLEDIYSGRGISMPNDLTIVNNAPIPMPLNWGEGQEAWNTLSREEQQEFVNG